MNVKNAMPDTWRKRFDKFDMLCFALSLLVSFPTIEPALDLLSSGLGVIDPYILVEM